MVSKDYNVRLDLPVASAGKGGFICIVLGGGAALSCLAGPLLLSHLFLAHLPRMVNIPILIFKHKLRG